MPPGGERTIRELVCHIGKCKLIFADQLFGEGTLSWDDPLIARANQVGGPVDEAIAWLKETHTAFRDGIASIADADLATTPSGYWGKPREIQ